MVQVWVIGGRARSASLRGTLSQVCDVVMQVQVLIPKESHLLDQLIRPVLWWGWRLLRRRWLLQGFPPPEVCDISHVIFSCSCPCNESARGRPGVVSGSSWVRWRIPHWSGVFPVCVFGIVSREDGFPVILEAIKYCPPDGGVHQVGGRGARAGRGGVVAPPLFVPVGLGVVDWGGYGRSPGCGWHGLVP